MTRLVSWPVGGVVDHADPARVGGLAALGAVVGAAGELAVVGVAVGRVGLEALPLELAGGPGELAVAVVAGGDGHGGLGRVGHAEVADRPHELAVGVVGEGGGMTLGVAAGAQVAAGKIAPQLGRGRRWGGGGGAFGLPALGGVVKAHRRVGPAGLGTDPARIPVAHRGLRRAAQRARRPGRIGGRGGDADRQRAARQPPVGVVAAVGVAGGGHLLVAGGAGRQAGDRQLAGLVVGEGGDKAGEGGLVGAGVVAAWADQPGAVAVGVVAIQGGQRPRPAERLLDTGGQATLVVVVAGGGAGLVDPVFDGTVGPVVGGDRPRGRAGGGLRRHREGGAVGQVVAVQGGVRGRVGGAGGGAAGRWDAAAGQRLVGRGEVAEGVVAGNRGAVAPDRAVGGVDVVDGAGHHPVDRVVGGDQGGVGTAGLHRVRRGDPGEVAGLVVVVAGARAGRVGAGVGAGLQGGLVHAVVGGDGLGALAGVVAAVDGVTRLGDVVVGIKAEGGPHQQSPRRAGALGL